MLAAKNFLLFVITSTEPEWVQDGGVRQYPHRRLAVQFDVILSWGSATLSIFFADQTECSKKPSESHRMWLLQSLLCGYWLQEILHAIVPCVYPTISNYVPNAFHIPQGENYYAFLTFCIRKITSTHILSKKYRINRKRAFFVMFESDFFLEMIATPIWHWQSQQFILELKQTSISSIGPLASILSSFSKCSSPPFRACRLKLMNSFW